MLPYYFPVNRLIVAAEDAMWLFQTFVWTGFLVIVTKTICRPKDLC